jgi:hypothetical protein
VAARQKTVADGGCLRALLKKEDIVRRGEQLPVGANCTVLSSARNVAMRREG